MVISVTFLCDCCTQLTVCKDGTLSLGLGSVAHKFMATFFTMYSMPFSQIWPHREHKLDEYNVIISHSLNFSFQGLRSKTRTMDSLPLSVDALPVWNFDGSSTGQAVGHDSDIYMKPVSTYRYVCMRSIDQQEVFLIILMIRGWLALTRMVRIIIHEVVVKSTHCFN